MSTPTTLTTTATLPNIDLFSRLFPCVWLLFVKPQECIRRIVLASSLWDKILFCFRESSGDLEHVKSTKCGRICKLQLIIGWLREESNLNIIITMMSHWYPQNILWGVCLRWCYFLRLPSLSSLQYVGMCLCVCYTGPSVVIIYFIMCLRWLFFHILSVAAYISRKIWVFYPLILYCLWCVQIRWVHCSMEVVFVCLHITLIIIITQNYLKALMSWDTCRVYRCLSLSQVLKVSSVHYMGPCAFN